MSLSERNLYEYLKEHNKPISNSTPIISKTPEINIPANVLNPSSTHREDSSSRSKTHPRHRLRYVMAVLLFLAVFFTIRYANSGSSNNYSSPTAPSAPAVPSASMPETTSSPAPSAPAPVQQSPRPSYMPANAYNGQIMENTMTAYERLAPLTVKTSGNKNYYILLKSKSAPNLRIGFYISAGKTLETEVPLGTYEIVYASGDTWYGKSILFGTDTAYSRCNDDFYFYFDRTDDSYVGYTLTLYPVLYGNMSTETISGIEFLS